MSDRITISWGSIQLLRATTGSLARNIIPVLLPLFAGLITIPPAADEPEPMSCKQLRAQQKQCALDGCDARALERLRKQCLQDGGPHVR